MPLCGRISELIALSDGLRWWQEAFDELHDALERLGLGRNGPDGALFTGDLFQQEHGEIVAFVPITGAPAPWGRAQPYEVPAAELAVTVHHGDFDELDRTYGALGTYVAEREIGVEGPNREYYRIEEAATMGVRIEVCWPVFRTREGVDQ